MSGLVDLRVASRNSVVSYNLLIFIREKILIRMLKPTYCLVSVVRISSSALAFTYYSLLYFYI